MKNNLRLNKIKGITVIRCALSGGKGVAKLWLFGSEFDFTTLSLLKKRFYEQYLLVSTITLRGMMRENHIKKLDVLKMDIEGEEYKVIKKDIKLISKNVERLLVEYHEDCDRKMRKKIISILIKNNFSVIFEKRNVLGFSNNQIIK